MMNQYRFFAVLVFAACLCLPVAGADGPGNLNNLPNDLTVPPVVDGLPQAGMRVWQRLPGYEEWTIAHALYLPTDWQTGARTLAPVLVEFPGNGNYTNKLGDRSDGRVQDCRMGFGLSGGRGCLWVSLPFLDPKTKGHALTWWGDPDVTAEYCRKAVAHVCDEYGGDRDRVVLVGFSRGAIAGNYIGLRDDATARLWRAFFLHSHYDGVRPWPYPDSDPASALARLQRLGTRPQFLSHELTTASTRAYVEKTRVEGNFTFVDIPYPNHSPDWLLKDLPERKTARDWLADVLKPQP